jgi:hypothetical protein
MMMAQVYDLVMALSNASSSSSSDDDDDDDEQGRMIALGYRALVLAASMEGGIWEHAVDKESLRIAYEVMMLVG